MKYTILGGGISGLATAHYLTKIPSTKKVVILEAANKLGGWINTSRFEDGVFLEHGPRSIRPAGPSGINTLELVEELGLADKVVPVKRGHPATKNRLVYVDSELLALPSGPLNLFFPKKPFTKPLFLAGIRDMLTRRKKCEDDSIYEFVKRRFGSEVADFAIDPLVRGICAGDARQISADAFVTTDLFRLEQEHGGVFKGLLKEAITKKKRGVEVSKSALVAKSKAEKWSVWSLKNGLTSLVEAMENTLQDNGVEIHKNVFIEEMQLETKNLKIQSSQGIFEQDHVLSSLPAFATSNLLRKIEPLSVACNMLDSIPYVNVGVVNLVYDGNVLNRDPAFGLLVPSSQNVPILGVVFDSSSFPQGDKTIFTVMMGGVWFKSLFGENATKEQIGDIAIKEVTRILELGDKRPSRVVANIHTNCIGQYTIGHRSRVNQARQCIEGLGLPLTLVGSSYDGVGVNDSIMSGKRWVQKITANA